MGRVDTSIPELWAKLTLRDQLRGGFWEKFVGPEGSSSPLIRATDTLNKPGDTIHIQTTDPLSGAGVSGGTTALTGSEKALATSSIKVIPLQYRHAVRGYRRAQKKSIVDLRMEAKMRLAEWGQEKVDDVRFSIFVQTANHNGVAYAGNFRSVGNLNTPLPGDIAAGEHITVIELQKAKLAMYNNRATALKTADRNDYFALVG